MRIRPQENDGQKQPTQSHSSMREVWQKDGSEGTEGARPPVRIVEAPLWRPVESDVKSGLHAKASLSANGGIVIPAAIRAEMGVAPGETLLMDLEDGVMRIESYPARIRRIQREFAKYAKPGILLSDELIAERREEARREEEEIEREKAARRGSLR